MVIKASILLLLAPFAFWCSAIAATVDSELNDAIQKKDWPGVVLLLQPLEGQNFEHDLVLAKALLSLERRAEALTLLQEISLSHKDERTQKLFSVAGTLFFNQDTSNLYYEAVQMISASKFAEAKDRLDQALAKEPGQVLVLARLIEVEMLLNLKDLARTQVKSVLPRSALFPELKVLSLKLDLDAPLAPLLEDELPEEPDWTRIMQPLKANLFDHEVPLTFWAEGLKRTKKTNELSALSLKTLKDHPNWSYALGWLYKNGGGTTGTLAKLKTQIEKNLKDRAEFDAHLAKEAKRTQYYWMGYATFESVSAFLLLNQVK